jgi:hypothetical protein
MDLLILLIVMLLIMKGRQSIETPFLIFHQRKTIRSTPLHTLGIGRVTAEVAFQRDARVRLFVNRFCRARGPAYDACVYLNPLDHSDAF